MNARFSSANVRNLLMIAVALAAGVAAGCNHKPTLSPQELEANLGEYFTFYEANLKVRQPQGYQKEAFVGFGNPQTKCILTARILESPFQPDFDKHINGKDKVLSREKVQVDNLPGLLLQTERIREDGSSSRSWTVVFGNQDRSWHVSSVYGTDLPPSVGEILRAAVLSARVDNTPTPAAGELQTFTCDTPASLKRVETVYRELIFTADGEVPTKTATAPLLRAVNYTERLPESQDPVAYCEEIVTGNRGLERFESVSTSAVTIDGLQGYETFAKCRHKKSGTPLAQYQVVLFDGDEKILMMGEVGLEASEKYLPEFKAAARSIKRKQASEK
ncbi:hypothetical protein NA78x_005350 [Anatilimnocola sp. NA78]|uniref:hypothetical protein n=1 Tax=Anatilimnocola sp. NA78 TaxID=3415683 RepID=UPI003CE5617C